MNGLIHSSLYFGMLVSVGAYMLGVWLKKKTGWAILNPLLVAIIVVIAFLSVFHIEYKEYNRGAVYLSYFLTPATVCLAIPLYKQLELLKKNFISVIVAIASGRSSGKCRQYLCDVPFLSTGAYALCDIASKVHYDGDWHGHQRGSGRYRDADGYQHYNYRNFGKYYSRLAVSDI